MQRRKFIQSSLIVTLTAAAASTGCVNPFESPEDKLNRLLSYLHQDHFKALTTGKNYKDLKSKLIDLGVILNTGEINIPVIQELALTDQLIIHNKFYYTQTEIDLYTMAFLSKQV